MDTKNKKSFFKTVIVSTRSLDISVDRLDQLFSIELKDAQKNDRIFSRIQKKFLTKTVEEWKVESLTPKKSKVTLTKTISNPFYFLIKFLLKGRLQKQTDKELQELVLRAY